MTRGNRNGDETAFSKAADEFGKGVTVVERIYYDGPKFRTKLTPR